MSKQRYMRWHWDWQYGLFLIRLFGWFVMLKAPWSAPLFSERERRGCWVLPIARGWRILVRKVK